MIESIVELAKAKSPEKRRAIMEHVSELFVEGADFYKDDELALFNTVLEGLLETISLSDKQALAAKLSRIDQVSRSLALALASDHESVAAGILQSSAVLTSEDLLKVAKTNGQGHLLALSKREHVEPRLTDILLERGEKPVHRSLAQNPGAEFSKWGKRMLVKLADTDETLRETLCARQDLDDTHKDLLFAQMSDEAARKLRMLLDANSGIVDDLFKTAGDILTSQQMKKHSRRIEAKAYLKEIRSGHRTLGKVIARLSISNALIDIIYILSELAGIERKYVANAMARKQSDALAIVCKAVGVDDVGYAALSRARCTYMRLPETAGEKWLSEFRVLKDADARRALGFIKLRLKTAESEAA